MQIVDLTQTMIHNLQVYPGDIPPTLEQTHSLEKDGYTNHVLSAGMHAGTHIDGPWHMVGQKKNISEIPLSQFVGRACVIDVSGEKEFNDVALIKGRCTDCDVILFYSGYGQLFGTEKYLSGYPVIGMDVAAELVESKVKMIGTDTLSPDISPYDVHKKLLSNEVLIAENLANLDVLLKYHSFKIIALPLKIDADSAPARIIALAD